MMKKTSKKSTMQRADAMITGGVVLLIVIMVAALVLRQSNNDPTSVVSAGVITEGRTLYDANCAACHGFALEGQADWKENNPDGSFRAPPHDETGHTWHHSDAYLVESIKLGGVRLPANIGVSTMPAYEGILTDVQIDAILAYIKSDWPDDILASQQSIPNP